MFKEIPIYRNFFIHYCSINVVISIWFDGDNISFEARHVMYINSTNIHPNIIINRIYENQYLLYIVPLMRHTNVVCVNSIDHKAIGSFVSVNINVVIVHININNFVK